MLSFIFTLCVRRSVLCTIITISYFISNFLTFFSRLTAMIAGQEIPPISSFPLHVKYRTYHTNRTIQFLLLFTTIFLCCLFNLYFYITSNILLFKHIFSLFHPNECKLGCVFLEFILLTTIDYHHQTVYFALYLIFCPIDN